MCIRDRYKTEDLFDGTFSTNLPQYFRNIRDKSYVPDNQEIFTNTAGHESFMFEITEPPQVPDTEVASFYFTDLAECNESVENAVTTSFVLPNEQMPFTAPSVVKLYLEGRQKIVPGKGAGTAESVHIFLVIVRLKEVNSDVVISLNVPCKESAEEFEAKVQSYKEVFGAVIGSFKVVSLEVFHNAMQD
eukprot:TRINITY_DN2525_c0_g1_i10.p1 TRINITY_DN2525_c0_g1~~TRINITY_DN2525_c0_g1_i10.p1  ORF type:complete len:189 (+),score=37.92 TRINITY_DN2525_c0_g1_i10:80-646(+)